MASVLNDKAIKPTDELLAAALKESKPLWDTVISHVIARYKKPSEEWKFYGTKSGWTLAVLSDKRRLINLIPQNGFFQAVFTLSEKAAAVARSSDLPQAIKAEIPTEAQCVCGYGMTLDIRAAADIDTAKKLLEIRIKTKMQKFVKGNNESDIPDVDLYIMKYSAEKQERLLKIRSLMFEQYPNAIERIYYGIPTVELNGKIILQYAAYKKHISLLVCNVLPKILKEKYPQYSYTEYTVVFHDNEPFPNDFVKEICGMLEKTV